MTSLRGSVSPLGERLDDGAPANGGCRDSSRDGPIKSGTGTWPVPDAPLPADIHARHDVLGQQNLLAEAFTEPSNPMFPGEGNDVAAAAAACPAPKVGHASVRRRVLKSILGLAVLAAAGLLPLQRFFEFSSVEAVVNARVVTLRAPIDGLVETGPALPEVGSAVAANTALLRVVNRRADRGRLDDLRRLSDLLESERTALMSRLALLRAQHAELVEQTRYFQQARILQLEARVEETASQIAAAAATRYEAAATLNRTAKLAETGAQSRAALDRAQRDETVASQGETTLRRRLFAVQVELEAARQGKYVGDSYNDRPSSSLHADEIAVRIGELEADLGVRSERLARLRASIDEESIRYAEQRAAEMTVPVSGTVWEVMTAPGEEVRAGRELLRILDCSGVVVTAAVSEKIYAGLRIGSPARFRPFGDGTDYAGKVIRLTGFAAPPDNLAIGASVLGRDLYRVTVSVPDLKAAACGVGRSGKVVFEPEGAAEIGGTAGLWLRQFLNRL